MSRESAGAAVGAPVGRRVVLGLLGLGAAGVAAGSSLSNFFGRIGGALSAHDPTGLSALIPGAGWRYYTVTDGFPYRRPPTYRLAVTGNVARELTLTTADLKTRPRTRLTADFQCVTGWRVANVRWEGVRLAELLDEAGADGDQHNSRGEHISSRGRNLQLSGRAASGFSRVDHGHGGTK